MSDEFVTVLHVGDDASSSPKSTTTVKSIVEEVAIYRLPGERLGMALKFEGGTCANEKIDKVYIQNINPGSPASRATSKTLDSLIEGDEILQINGKPVCAMTRIACVTCLRDAPVCISVTIKRDVETTQQRPLTATDIATNGGHEKMPTKNNASPSNNTQPTTKTPLSSFKSHQSEQISSGIAAAVAKKGPPPPIPPRLASTTLTRTQRKLAEKHNGSNSHTNGNACNNEQHSHTNGNSVHVNGNKKRPPPPLPPRRPEQPPPAVPANNAKNSENTSSHTNNHVNTSESHQTPPPRLRTNGFARSIFHDPVHNKSDENLVPTPEVYIDLLSDKEGNVCAYAKTHSFCIHTDSAIMYIFSFPYILHANKSRATLNRNLMTLVALYQL